MLRIFKTRFFARWAKKENVEDSILLNAADLSKNYLNLSSETISKLLKNKKFIEVLHEKKR